MTHLATVAALAVALCAMAAARAEGDPASPSTDGVKEFHLVAEPVVRELAPGMKANLWGYNGQSPGPTIEVVEGDRVRIRMGNLTMTSHPIHLHGHEFMVTGTDGGPLPRQARWHEVTTDVAVRQMRQLEFVADAPGDWAFHCHKSHHTMNAMGHGVPTMIGVEHRGLVGKIQKLVPDYMVMGERGMADMGAMEMPLPDNTLPMMSGQGQFGPAEMGGMFTLVEVRRDQRAGDFRDPGDYRHPAGTVAYEFTGRLSEPASAAAAPGTPRAPLNVRKPGPSGHSNHH